MKFIYYLLILFLIMCSSCKIAKHKTEISSGPEDSSVSAGAIPPPATNFSEQTTWLLGYFNRTLLTYPPHSEWFLKGYDEYILNQDAVNKLTAISKEGVVIKIVMGSWCPDSRREVPRFMKILDFWKFPAESLRFIGVDDSKISPIGDYDKLEIVRVPTFIIYKNNVEAGRIIENPSTSLEQDMVDILSRGMKN